MYIFKIIFISRLFLKLRTIILHMRFLKPDFLIFRKQFALIIFYARQGNSWTNFFKVLCFRKSLILDEQTEKWKIAMELILMIFRVILLAVGINSIFKVWKKLWKKIAQGNIHNECRRKYGESNFCNEFWDHSKSTINWRNGLNDVFQGENSSSSFLALVGSSPLYLSYSIPSNTAFNQLLRITHIAIFGAHSCSLYRIRLAVINFNSFA